VTAKPPDESIAELQEQKLLCALCVPRKPGRLKPPGRYERDALAVLSNQTTSFWICVAPVFTL